MFIKAVSLNCLWIKWRKYCKTLCVHITYAFKIKNFLVPPEFFKNTSVTLVEISMPVFLCGSVFLYKISKRDYCDLNNQNFR